ncbi:MAG: DNRLRE domain-containing protein, partial [Chloroflexota bacterium]
DYVRVMKWANIYMGKPLAQAPSAFVAMREAGYADNWYPQKGNHTYWLYQLDNVAGGRTVVTTYRSKRDLVDGAVYDYWVPSLGEDNVVRSTIETNQSFLGPSFEGWIARRTNQPGNPYMFFNVDDRFVYGGPRTVYITVTYLDRGTDQWRLIYDAASNANKTAGTITKTNTGTWKKKVFVLTDAYLGNRQTGGADFYLDCMGDGNEYIHMVDVSLTEGPATATPTATRDPNITPSATPSPSITPTPSATPTASPTSVTSGTPVIRDFSPTQDTYLYAWDTTANYGNDMRLNTRYNIENSLLQFDLSGQVPTNSTVRMAVLRVYLDWYDYMSDVSPQVSVYKMKRDWREMEASWRDRMSGLAWGGPGASDSGDRELSRSSFVVVTANSKWYEWDVTGLVQDWVWNPAGNKGMLLMANAKRPLRFHSQQETWNKPYLRVEYVSGGVGPTPGTTASPTATPTTTPRPGPTRDTFELRVASKDTYIDSAVPDKNYGKNWLHVYGPGWYRTLISFDVSRIPSGAEVLSARMELTTGNYSKGSGALNIGAYLVRKPWVELQATWRLASAGNPWNNEGCNSVPGDRDGAPVDVVTVNQVSSGLVPYQLVSYTWDVTRIVQAWVDAPGLTDGLLLMDPAGGTRGVAFIDSDYLGDKGDHLHPRLLVEWQLREPTPTPTPPAGAVQGTVYNDRNGNGVREAGELGVAGATVELWSGATRVRFVATAGSGAYLFDSVAAGSYSLQVVPPTGYRATTQSPKPVTISAGATLTEDMGIRSSQSFLPLIIRQ